LGKMMSIHQIIFSRWWFWSGVGLVDRSQLPCIENRHNQITRRYREFASILLSGLRASIVGSLHSVCVCAMVNAMVGSSTRRAWQLAVQQIAWPAPAHQRLRLCHELGNCATGTTLRLTAKQQELSAFVHRSCGLPFCRWALATVATTKRDLRVLSWRNWSRLTIVYISLC
jgi:hypothetical protein